MKITSLFLAIVQVTKRTKYLLTVPAAPRTLYFCVFSNENLKFEPSIHKTVAFSNPL